MKQKQRRDKEVSEYLDALENIKELEDKISEMHDIIKSFSKYPRCWCQLSEIEKQRRDLIGLDHSERCKKVRAFYGFDSIKKRTNKDDRSKGKS